MNFVLIHGGFHGGWCWKFVAARLRALGHQVSCPTHTGMGERRHLLRADLTLDTFAQDILAHLYEEELTDIVLLGHSFGGLSVSLVADRDPERIRHLVYLDALLIAPGQTPYGALPPEVIEQRKKSCVEYQGVSCFPPLPATAFGVPADHPHAGWLSRHLCPQPESLYESTLNIKNPIGNGLPCTYMACTDPVLPSVQASQAFAKSQSRWQYVEMAACHDVMVTEPDLLASMLLDCVPA